MHRKGKPARKCYSCILKLRNHCAIHTVPHDKWHNSKCSSYNDIELYREYLEEFKKHPEDNAKRERRNIAKKHNTEEHHQGMRIKRIG